MDPSVNRPDGVALFFGIAMTVFAHAAFVALLVVANVFADEEVPEDTIGLTVMSAELLMYGDLMPDDNELPWIANPEQAPQVDDTPDPAPVPEEETTLPEQETVVLDPDAVVENRPEENRAHQEETVPEREQRRDRGETNENRPENERPRMGSQQGFEGGTSLSAAAMQNQLAGLQAQLGRALRRPAAISDSEYRQLTATVYIRCTVAGQITTWRFVDESGNRLFDAAVESMLNRFRMGSDRLRLSTVTNDALRQQMVNDGFQVPVVGR